MVKERFFLLQAPSAAGSPHCWNIFYCVVQTQGALDRHTMRSQGH
jgi:hypothetical protein